MTQPQAAARQESRDSQISSHATGLKSVIQVIQPVYIRHMIPKLLYVPVYNGFNSDQLDNKTMFALLDVFEGAQSVHTHTATCMQEAMHCAIPSS